MGVLLLPLRSGPKHGKTASHLPIVLFPCDATALPWQWPFHNSMNLRVQLAPLNMRHRLSPRGVSVHNVSDDRCSEIGHCRTR
jgi:hypothetical protein